MRTTRRGLLVVASLAGAAGARAQSAPTQSAPTQRVAPPTPCAHDADARRFDFWVGAWDVRTRDGAHPTGESRIEVVSGGCALLEHWTSSAGATGKSLNFYNRAARQWQQYWVGQGGDATQYTTSTWDGATLVFLADAVRRDGTPVRRRLSFTPVAADTVRQLGETSADAGGTWTTDYDFLYVRRR